MKIDTFFFKTKTHKVLTWRGRVILLVALVLLCMLSWPLVRWSVTRYIYHVDDVQPTSRLVVENWDGSIQMFEGAHHVAGNLGAREMFSIIFEDDYADVRKRHAYILNAWAVGIDTLHLTLIPVSKTEPKTLHIGQGVLEFAHQHQWQDLTVVTFDLHSARSRKAYLLAALPYNISVRFIGIPLEEIDHTNWTKNGTGLAMAFSELLKKLYYDLFVF